MAFKATELNLFIFLYLPFILTRKPKGYCRQYRNKNKQHKGKRRSISEVILGECLLIDEIAIPVFSGIVAVTKSQPC